MKTSIVMSVYNDYELLRQCMESVFQTIFDEIEEIIIVDDYSNFVCKLRPYLEYLENKYNKIKVIRSDEYRLSIHAKYEHLRIAISRGQKELDGMVQERQTMGHGYALQQGINVAESDIVFCIDQDIVLLQNSKGMIGEIHKLFADNPKVACISQLAGLMSNSLEIMKEAFRYKMGDKLMGKIGGTPSGSIFFLRRVLKDANGDQISLFNGPAHHGWLLSSYMPVFFENGYYTMNYPLFSQKKVFHCGGGSLKRARFGGEAGMKGIKYGMLRDGNTYGGRIGHNDIAEWYQGRYILDMDTLEYISYLESKYDKPFDEMQPPLDENKLYVANKETFLTYSERS